MTAPLVRLQAVTFLAFLIGAIACGASGYSLFGSLIGGVIVGVLSAAAMVAVLALEAADRRAHRQVVREPQSHVRVEEAA